VWEIVEHQLFADMRDELEPDVQRMDEILEGFYWALGTDPTQFFRLYPDRNLWLAKTDAFPGAPRLQVWYRLNPPQVELLAIELIMDDES
jgi:hypothetical protein